MERRSVLSFDGEAHEDPQLRHLRVRGFQDDLAQFALFRAEPIDRGAARRNVDHQRRFDDGPVVDLAPLAQAHLEQLRHDLDRLELTFLRNGPRTTSISRRCAPSRRGSVPRRRMPVSGSQPGPTTAISPPTIPCIGNVSVGDDGKSV